SGGLFALKDFADHTSTWVEPVSTTYRGHTVWQIPPPGQGIAVLEMLNLLEGYDLKKLGPDSADYWHLFLEAQKLAYADRAPPPLLRRPRFRPAADRRADLEAVRRAPPQADQPGAGPGRGPGRQPQTRPQRHDLPHRGGRGPQLRVADPEHLLRLRLRPGA